MYLLWKDDGSTMTWDHFRWDEVVVPNHTMKNIKIPAAGKPDAMVPSIADTMIAGGTGKTELANAPVTLVQLGDQRDALNEALTAENQAKEAHLTARLARRDAARTLRVSMKCYALHASGVYKADPMSLQPLGLTVVEKSPAVGVLPAPTTFRARPGRLDQSIDLRWNPVPGRESHQLQCAESVDGPWSQVYQGKKAGASCTNLVSGKEYFFRVRAQSSTGPGAWSSVTNARAT